jgi:hypothetical protein
MAKFVHIAPVESKTEYTPRKAGDEHCSNCEHFLPSENGCNGPKMKAMSKQPRLSDGNVKVSSGGWCKFWEEK